MLQKMEADVRGHIRVSYYYLIYYLQLEHEMKIHLDYLEGRVEELENTVLKLNSDKKSHQKKYTALEDKLKSLQSEKQTDQEENTRLRERIEAVERRYKDLQEKANRDQIELLQKTKESQQHNKSQ